MIVLELYEPYSDLLQLHSLSNIIPMVLWTISGVMTFFGHTGFLTTFFIVRTWVMGPYTSHRLLKVPRFTRDFLANGFTDYFWRDDFFWPN